MKELLSNYIKQVNKMFGFRHGTPRMVAEFQLMVMNSDYFVPDIHFSTESALKQKPLEMAVFAEIWVNHICVYREFTIISKSVTVEEAEKKSLEKLMISLIAHGISSSYEIIKENESSRV